MAASAPGSRTPPPRRRQPGGQDDEGEVTQDPHRPTLPADPSPEFTATGVAERGRGGRAATAAAGILAVFVAVAIMKPWDRAPVALPSAESSGALVAASVAPSAAVPSATPRTYAAPPSRIAVARAIEYHDAWGIRALVGAGELREVWLAAPQPMPDGAPALGDSAVRAVIISAAERPVRLLGLTTPSGIQPTRVRIAVARPLGQRAELELRQLRVRRFGEESLLYERASGEDWAPGIYQVRIDVGDSVTAITIAIYAGPAR